MPTQTVNDENIAALLKSGIVFVDWWAPWCGPCRVFEPIFERVAEQNPEVVFAKVNAEEHPDLAVSFGIRAIPTLMVFRDGILVFSQVGALPEEALQVLAGRVKDLDMDRVRAEVAAHAKMQN
ncbi:MAG TPA: thioredoxin [Polyangia bacterium]|jgi:thioredoxin|nr:thioredoxin [Polyangia bacterium]